LKLLQEVPMRPLSIILKILGLLVVTVPIGTTLSAHEFWIDPVEFEIPKGDPLVANIRVGKNFSGAAFSFIPNRFKRFEVITAGVAYPVLGRLGDRPALTMTKPEKGLNIAVYVTGDMTLTYREWGKFETFLRHKDFAWGLAEHTRRGLPEIGFKERYSRYAKSLIAVGGGAGQDSEIGLLTELVAEANPYTDDLTDGLPLRVFYQGKPRANAQVELFEKHQDGTVKISLHTTDEAGLVQLPVLPGRQYLADAVVLRAVDPAASDGAVWESLWAALTFATPQ
jgi:uncharacterized GH25 family protein